mmetsp:Transcript_33706/g.72759  ORF Transcript_33706/g.72759 Transcript_33706/m.72759 type:complete len:200 (-) Transcript_33706:49-648(-)
MTFGGIHLAKLFINCLRMSSCYLKNSCCLTPSDASCVFVSYIALFANSDFCLALDLDVLRFPPSNVDASGLSVGNPCNDCLLRSPAPRDSRSGTRNARAPRACRAPGRALEGRPSCLRCSLVVSFLSCLSCRRRKSNLPSALCLQSHYPRPFEPGRLVSCPLHRSRLLRHTEALVSRSRPFGSRSQTSCKARTARPRCP